MDSYGKKAGKGALIQEELSATLGVSQDQTLFQPKTFAISSYDSNAMKSSNPHSGIYETDTARTLDLNGGNPACNQGGIVIIENHPADSRVNIDDSGTCQTLTSRMGTGGATCHSLCTQRADARRTKTTLKLGRRVK